MAANHIARRANRTAARSNRPPIRFEITTEDGEVKSYRRKLRRPSRRTASTAAIAESRLGGAWA